MVKNKGFTLIELLAVIVILAILAVIITPVVTKTITNSKQKGFERSIDGLVDAALTDYATNAYGKITTYTLSGNKYSSSESDGNIKINGKIENGIGKVVIWRNGSYAVAIHSDDYCATKTVDQNDITISPYNGTCDVDINYKAIRDDLAKDGIESLATPENKSWIFTDDYGNIRYRGAEPDNYVWFNEELWRIIGIVDGKVKIIKSKYLDTQYAWASSNRNDWSKASLQIYFNGDYYNSIQSPYKEMIVESEWYLGAANLNSTLSPKGMYENERGEGACPSCDYELTWIGKIGLMYPSDFGYASATECTSVYSSCGTNNWLKKTTEREWILTPGISGSNMVWVLQFSNATVIANHPLSTANYVRPTLNLKSNVRITSGTGTSSDPYQLSQ